MGLFSKFVNMMNGGKKKEVEQPKPQPKPAQVNAQARPQPTNFAPRPHQSRSQGQSSQGDEYISYSEFKRMTQGNYNGCQIGNIKLVVDGNGGMSMNDFNMSNGVLHFEVNGIRRVFNDTRGIRGFYLKGRKLYVAIDDNMLSSLGSAGAEVSEAELAPLETNKEFSLEGVNKIVAKSTAYDINISSGDACEVSCNAGVQAEIKGNKLVIEVPDNVEIVLPSDRSDLNLELCTTSGDINVSDIAVQNVSANATSGDINLDIVAVNVMATATSGDLNINHEYSNNGGASLSTTSGDINYSVSNVGTMNLSVSGDYDGEDYEGEDGGYLANVSITSNSGSINVD